MNKGTVAFLRALALLTLLLARPLSVRPEEPLLVGVAGPAVNLVYSFVAQDAGFYQKYCFVARFVVFDAGSLLSQAALSGEVKISISSGAVTIASRSQGADTIIVAACVNTLPYSMVAANGITNWDQLRGKKIAISRFGSLSEFLTRASVRHFGVDPKDGPREDEMAGRRDGQELRESLDPAQDRAVDQCKHGIRR